MGNREALVDAFAFQSLQGTMPNHLQVKGLVSNREALVDALSPLGAENVVGGEGAIYLFAKLPEGEHVQWFSGCLRDWHFGMLA